MLAVGPRACGAVTVPPRVGEPSSAEALSPDLALYREVITAVRHGGDYYDAAHKGLLTHQFPVTSPLNWRLPTYAWTFALCPHDLWMRCVLVGISWGGVALSWKAGRKWLGVGWPSLLVTALSCGVVVWSIMGAAWYAQETWSGILLLLSLNASLLGGRWRWLALVTGCAAVAWRELALPYCVLAGGLAARHRRWSEACGWLVGVLCFLGFYAWHTSQVQLQLQSVQQHAAAHWHQWLTWGGVEFLLRSARMNGLLFALPRSLLVAYVAVAICGWPLSKWVARFAGRKRHRREMVDIDARQMGSETLLGRTVTSTGGQYRGSPSGPGRSSANADLGSGDPFGLAVASAACYAVLFCCFGRPENIYWGLVSAPCLLWAFAAGMHSLARLAGWHHSTLRPPTPVA